MSFEYIYLDDHKTHLLSQKQCVAVDKFVKSRGGIAWWKVGEGKSRIGLFVFASLQNCYRWSLPSICLIVCRRRAFYDWREEIERCFSDSAIFEDQVPIHPPSLQPVFLLVSAGELKKREEELQANKFIRFVIVDESWMFANPKATRSKSLYNLTMSRKSVALSGTIMKARDTAEIFSQCHAVQKHRYLAKGVTDFRTKFQIIKQIETKTGLTFPTFSPQPGSYQRIMSILEPIADVYYPSNKDRKIHQQFHNVSATSEQQSIFRELKEFYSVESLGLEFKSALEIGIKAQKIANGWIDIAEGKIQAIPTNKIKKLSDELEDIIASGERAVVWCAFRYDVEMLAAFLPFASLQMRGGQDFDVDRWLNDSDIRLCLATEASGSSVNHFAQTPYAIYFSSNYRWLDMQQSRGRTDRKSSLHTSCYYKYLQVIGSLDSHVFHTALESGAREQELIYQSGVGEWLKQK